MKDRKLTIRLPSSELEFAKAYARAHGLTLTGLVQRFFSQLRKSEATDTPASVAEIAGLVPGDLDVRDDYTAHILRKHS